MKKLPLLLAGALLAQLVFSSSAEELNWAPDVKKAIDDLVVAVGKDSPGYDAAHRPYAVFDFDNTTCIFDIQYQAYIYQLETMSFAMNPTELRKALFKDVSGTALTNMIEDACVAYGKLYKDYGPFTPKGLTSSQQATLAKNNWWLEFASKMRELAENEGELAESWPVRWFSGMTPDEVHSVISNSCAKYEAIATCRQTIEGPTGIKSLWGPVTNTFLNGLKVSNELKWLYRTLDENGIDVWICSASEINQVRAAVDHFGLHDYLTGAVAKTLKFDEDGKMLPEYDYETGHGYFAEDGGSWREDTLVTRANCAEHGKVMAIDNAIAPHYDGRAPVAGFMDSTGDFNFCTIYADMKLVICFNRADRKITDGGGIVAEVAMYERDTLGYDLAKANAAGDTLYVLQGRDENGMRALIATNATLRYGETEYRLFRNQDNYDQLQQMIDGKMSVAEAFDTCAAGCIADYAGYHAFDGWKVLTMPWQQDVYTNRFTVMCETEGEVSGLRLQYGTDFGESVAMTATNGLKEGTFVYKASITIDGEEGKTLPYRLAVGEYGLTDTEGAVKLWQDGDAAFTCAIWGDNQEGVHEYDWGNDDTQERYRCIRSMFGHMAAQKPDFGFSTGDFSSGALYDEEIEPGEMRGVNDIFGRTVPYHLVWGNHDCIGNFFGEIYTNAVQRYFSPAASEEDGWFHLYRNDVLFIGVHWTWGKGDAESRYDQIVQGIEELLKTERAKQAKFRIIVQHAPIFLECYNVLPKINWFSDTRLLDVAKAGGVDLVFSGHTHAYERIEHDGIVQIVNGGMGYLDHGERWYNNYGADTKVGGHRNTPLLWARQAPSTLNTQPPTLGAAEPVRMGCFQGYGMLSVTNGTLTYKAHAFNADGSYIGVADAFSIESKTKLCHPAPTPSMQAVSIGLDLSRPIDNAAWGEYKAAIGEPFEYDVVHAHDPVVNVSKTEIERFCKALNAGGGHNYRLPTESELRMAFGGDLKREVSEWTMDVDPSTGWCRILGGNKVAVDYTWCREIDKPAIASPDCHANYLGFRVIDAAAPSVVPSAVDQALKALEGITNPSEVYKWDGESLEDISEDWTDGKLMTKYDYTDPVIFTGKGDLKYTVSNDITFGGGVAAPNATSLDFSHVIGGNAVTIKGDFRGGVATNEWKFLLKCDELTLDGVTYRGQVFNASTDSRELKLVGTNDFSGAVMSLCVDKKLIDPNDLFVTNLVSATGEPATLILRRLDFSTRGVVEEALGKDTAGFTIGENVTLMTVENVLFGIKGATLTVDGALDAAGIDMAGHLMGLLPQTATVRGEGTVKTTHFGMCDKSTLYVGVADLTLLSSVPYRTYTACTNSCNVKPIGDDPTGNPMRYFRDEDAVAYTNCVKSIENVQFGELYTLAWDRDADYHLDRVLDAGLTTSIGMTGWMCTNILNNAPVPEVVTGFGCSAFMATNSVGQHLVGRNFDYRYQMTHVLLYVPANDLLDRPYASVSTVDCGWLGYNVGDLDNGTNDISYAALFPHQPLDGMNEKGLMVTVLSLDAREKGPAMTEQYYPGRSNAVTTTAIRYLLDHADSTETGVNMLTNRFNMFFAIGDPVPIKANYHFYLCDTNGDARVVEWLQPEDGSGNWTTWVTNATAVSNFYLNDNYGHGSNRWEILRHALARQNHCLEEGDAMNLCRAVSQRKGADQTSWTHWSVVYNLENLSAEIATLGNYDEIFAFRLNRSDVWKVDPPTSARPTVRKDLPMFDATTAEPGKVYRLADPISGTSGEPSSCAGASVAAVNRMGLTYDAGSETLHAVATNPASAKCRAVFYVDMSSKDVSKALYSIVAGVNEHGLAARVVKFRNSTGVGDVSPSKTLSTVLSGSETFEAALVMMGEYKQSEGGCGFILSDAMGNVAVWGPENAELPTDDASEMVRYSVDLRKGIYEVDGDGRGEFDELPGFMRLASSDTTRAAISMGYGHLDVFLPNETNVAWRAELEGADVPVYGVISEPTSVAHTTVAITSDEHGTATVRNNRGQLVAETNDLQKVTYTAEEGYYFSDGSSVWEQTFEVSKAQTNVPAPAEPSDKPAVAVVTIGGVEYKCKTLEEAWKLAHQYGTAANPATIKLLGDVKLKNTMETY